MATVSGGSIRTTSGPKTGRPRSSAERRQEQARRAAVLLKQVSDPTRIQVVLMLAEGEKFVGELCQAMNLPQPAVSHHLALMRHAGLVIPRRAGKNNYYALSETGEMLAEAVGNLVA